MNDSTLPKDADQDEPGSLLDDARPHLSGAEYYRLRRHVTFATAAVAIVPLIIMTISNYYAYSRTLRSEAIESVSRLTTSFKRSLEFFISERRSALSYVGRDRNFGELCDSRNLARIIRNVNESFETGAFVDLGVIESDGRQRCYSGPYDLTGRNYASQDWFRSASQRSAYTSDIFLGYRNSPHFAIAARFRSAQGSFYILRATVDSELLSRQLLAAGEAQDDDIFLINREGILQTPSTRYGRVLEHIPLAVPNFSNKVEVLERNDETGTPIYLGYAYVADSPFVLMFIKPAGLSTSGSLLVKLLVFLVVSIGLILGVVLWGARQFVANMRSVNLKRAALMHQVEYNARLASLGRLSAGVAHEINNPLAVINEKAGLLQDITLVEPQSPYREKALSLLDSVLASVGRCKRITHRLLGFARHMDVRVESIDIRELLEEVVGFLGKEAEYRNIRITFAAQDEVPTVQSDRGQLQQVFLNILNNAVAAVKDSGHIDIAINAAPDGAVSVAIRDDGVGIPRENMQRVFEPFFTTKEGSGTGLGLSITYGIVKKLGGEITVESEVGVGTCFTVLLRAKRRG